MTKDRLIGRNSSPCPGMQNSMISFSCHEDAYQIVHHRQTEKDLCHLFP